MQVSRSLMNNLRTAHTFEASYVCMHFSSHNGTMLTFPITLALPFSSHSIAALSQLLVIYISVSQTVCCVWTPFPQHLEDNIHLLEVAKIFGVPCSNYFYYY